MRSLRSMRTVLTLPGQQTRTIITPIILSDTPRAPQPFTANATSLEIEKFRKNYWKYYNHHHIRYHTDWNWRLKQSEKLKNKNKKLIPNNNIKQYEKS